MSLKTYMPITDTQPDLPDAVRSAVDEAIAEEQDRRNAAAGAVRAMRGLDAGDVPSPAEPARAAGLNCHEIKTSSYQEQLAAEVSGLFGLFGGKAERAKATILHEAKQFRIAKGQSGANVEIGVSVRLVAAIESKMAEAKLTLPDLAAEAQLNTTRGEITIAVRGFAGSLGHLLPAPKELNVETLHDYLNAFSAIQAHIFGPEQIGAIEPSPLGFFQ